MTGNNVTPIVELFFGFDRVRRLEKEILKLKEALEQYLFIKLDADGSLLINEKVSIILLIK